MEEGKKLKYIRVKKWVAACPTCNEELMGSNSIMSPYFCTKCKVEWHCNYNDISLYLPVKVKDNSDLVTKYLSTDSDQKEGE